MQDLDIAAPAGYVPAVTIGIGQVGGDFVPIDAANPLPVHARASQSAATSTALVGQTSVSGVIGPFHPELGRAIWCTLSGNWSGSVFISRSRDGGSTRQPLTYIDGSAKGPWTANVNCPIGEESVGAAQWFLEFTRSTGTLDYRLEQ